MNDQGTSDIRYLDEDEFQRRSEEAFRSFDDLDVGNLLNEDLERSRNALLFVTLAAISISVFEITEISALGLKIEVNSAASMKTHIFFFLATIALGAYYVINARADQIAKRTKHQILDIRMKLYEGYLAFVREGAKESSEDATLLPHQKAMIERLRELQQEQTGVFRKYRDQLSYQRRMIKLLPWGIFALCVTTEALAVLAKYLYF